MQIFALTGVSAPHPPHCSRANCPLIYFSFIEDHTKQVLYIFFASSYRTFTKIHHMIVHKISLKHFPSYEVCSLRPMGWSWILMIRYLENPQRIRNWTMCLLSNSLAKEVIIETTRKYFGLSNNENTTSTNVWNAAGAVLRNLCH